MTLSIAAALLLCASLFTLWLVSVAVKDASIVDVFWGPGFALVAWTCAWTRDFQLDAGQWLLVALVTVWALRLGLYLGWRNLGKGEDRRYAAMREGVGEWFWLVSLGTVFGLQGVLMYVISTPIQTALLGPGGGVGLLAMLGALVWLVGLVFEAVGDAQLARFKADPDNAGAVMDRGLWRYTRHPNYFGDFTVWWGLFLVAAGLGAPWWTVVAPVIMSILLMRVSGVPLLERSLKQRRPGYEDYVRRTSAFFPRPPKR